jgi:hypothetical protein
MWSLLMAASGFTMYFTSSLIFKLKSMTRRDVEVMHYSL